MNGKEENPVAMVVQTMVDAISSRHEAAAVLQQLAEHVSWGGYPHEITPRQVGQAVGRAMINCSGRLGDNLAEFIRGYLDYAKEHASLL